MNFAVVLERHPVNHFVNGRPVTLEFSAVQTAQFQAVPEALSGRIVPAGTFAV